MTVEMGSPLVVVANRLPFTLKTNPCTGKLERQQSAGGLVTAVAPVVVDSGGLWVGWSGLHLENDDITIPESNPEDRSPTAGLKSEQVVAINIEKKLFNDYYNGCCNATFWPLFHSMPDRAIFEADKWEAYRKVNEEYARLTVKAVERLASKNPNAVPLVWLHDYHLMLAATSIRAGCEELGIPVKIAFFLHIPFPSWDIMRLFPWDDELLQGILACDSIGFHVEDYCLNFIDCCHRRLGCRIDRNLMLIESLSHTVGVHPLPISIPYMRFNQLALDAPSYVNNNDKEQLILGVDRLDYTKGLVNRLKAFELLLEKYPEHIENVSFLQVAVPSRTDVKEYQELKEDLDRLIGRINGRFSTANWSPIRYIFGCVSQDQLAAYYRDASVAVVTPLRDGMNLVAKEFVACQTNEPGVLILSPFAGAGTSMHEALLVNPYEINEFSDTLHRALTMSNDERELRMKQLQRREVEHDVNFWLKSFLKTVDCLLDTQVDDHIEHTETMDPISENDFKDILGSYVTKATNLTLLLDYDGTLAPIAPHPDLAIIPEETRRCLERLSHMSDVHIAVISSRSLENVRSMVGIEGITYAGNHGLEILQPDGNVYIHPVPCEYENKLTTLRQRLLDEACLYGAWVDKKEICITFHYRAVPKDKLDGLLSKVQKIFKEVGIPIYQSLMAYEARPDVTWDKGRAAIYILRSLTGLDWSQQIATIYAGDRNTDEDAMKALKGMSVSFRVTPSKLVKTNATHCLPSTDAVLLMLKWIEKQMGSRAPKSIDFNPVSSKNNRRNSYSRSGSNSPPPKQLMLIDENINHKSPMVFTPPKHLTLIDETNNRYPTAFTNWRMTTSSSPPRSSI